MITFPLNMTFAEVAALPGAADAFSWDDSQIDEEFEPDLADRIAAYSTVVSPNLALYLVRLGFEVTEADGVTIANRNALDVANALFHSVMYEYDAMDLNNRKPTWDLFDLHGDDDVDYNGSQPSCLTVLLSGLVA